jgi:DNA primase
MPWVDYRDLRQKLDITDVLAWMGWQPTSRHGEYLRGSCPFCGNVDSPGGREFSVHCGRKLFRCFRCQTGGNVLDLWSRFYKIDIATAANELSKKLRSHAAHKSSN